jgi:2,3-dihydroxybenzoate decarboxylase
MGVERILFSIDWPFMSNRAGRRWIDAVPVSDRDRTLILGVNARKLLKLS